MPALIGYMLAIVITLGGYFAALNWLIRPPDPWQSVPKCRQAPAQPFAARKRPPAVKSAEAANYNYETTTPAEPDTRLASVETSEPLAASETETTAPLEPAIVQAPLPAESNPGGRRDAHVARRDVSATKTRPGIASGSRETRAVNWN